ncbi:hypothetical protein [Vibrio marisflavi]|uniref:Uncharacterized protein n=1 Tax=Vibrio marisflavi CECT 7928 TaxID=634439 RepID=A0ABM9A0N9_9VIBR|nr:hypothetical protein [Vibrio marisflavi]CAH0537066.1 hypothetical protein VMF7928_00902 [Vibrio marisflavi CECT 7928]
MRRKIVLVGLVVGVVGVLGFLGYRYTLNHQALLHSIAANMSSERLDYVSCKSNIAYLPEYQSLCYEPLKEAAQHSTRVG